MITVTQFNYLKELQMSINYFTFQPCFAFHIDMYMESKKKLIKHDFKSHVLI